MVIGWLKASFPHVRKDLPGQWRGLRMQGGWLDCWQCLGASHRACLYCSFLEENIHKKCGFKREVIKPWLILADTVMNVWWFLSSCLRLKYWLGCSLQFRGAHLGAPWLSRLSSSTLVAALRTGGCLRNKDCAALGATRRACAWASAYCCACAELVYGAQPVYCVITACLMALFSTHCHLCAKIFRSGVGKLPKRARE